MIYHQVILSRIKCFNVEITHGEKVPSSRLILLKLNCCKEKLFTQICTNLSYSKLAKIVLPNKKQAELDKSYFSCIAQVSLHLSFHFLNVTSMYDLKIFRAALLVLLTCKYSIFTGWNKSLYIQKVRNIIMANYIDWRRSQ